MTTTTDLSEIPNHVLKTDCMGRVRFPAKLREELLDRFDRSGMSGAEFAKFYHLKYTTFASWRQKRDRERKKAAGEPHGVTFVELTIPEEPLREQSHVGIDLPGGAKAWLKTSEDVKRIAELLRALEDMPC